MTALINRATAVDALARARYERVDSHFTMPGGFSWEAYKLEDPDGARGLYIADAEEDIDVLVASGAVIDAATLADDEALVRHVALLASGVPQTKSDLARANAHLRALTAALTERGDQS